MSKQTISYYFDPQLGAPLDARAAGTDATRPSIGLYTGLLRYNTEHNKFEYYDGSWTDLQLVPPIPDPVPNATTQPCLIYDSAASAANWAKFPLLMTHPSTEVRTLPAWTVAGKHLATNGTGLAWVDPPTFDYPQHWTTGANKLKILGGGFIGTSEVQNGPNGDVAGAMGDVAGAMATHTVRTREILPYANTNLNSNSNNANAHKTTLLLGSSTTPVTELHVGASPLSDLKEENNNYLVNAEVGDPVCNINANLTMGQITKRSGVTMAQITTGDPSHNLTLTPMPHPAGTSHDPAPQTGHVQIGTGTATHINLEPKLVVNGHMRVDGTVEGTLATTDVTVSNTLTVNGDATFNGNVNIGGNSRVYFSVQLGNGAGSKTGAGGQRYINHLNELQSNVHPNTQGLAGYSDTWDISGMLSSGGNDQAGFATNGYVVPRDGVYKIDGYQTVKSSGGNSALAGLRVYRNPIANGNYYNDSTMIASCVEMESNDMNPPLRALSVVWMGQLNQDDAIKFMITCDNGFGPQSGSFWSRTSCYTIMSVD
jgi:hypothetical protein